MFVICKPKAGNMEQYIQVGMKVFSNANISSPNESQSRLPARDKGKHMQAKQ